MGIYGIVALTKVDEENGFRLGQVVEGEMKTVKRLPPFEGTKEIFEVKDCDFYLLPHQVVELED